MVMMMMMMMVMMMMMMMIQTHSPHCPHSFHRIAVSECFGEQLDPLDLSVLQGRFVRSDPPQPKQQATK
eukprot:5577529-Amphidinium_carterae.1